MKKVSPHYKWNFLLDEDDNKFVDCAIAANADFKVSNDKGFRELAKIDFPKVDCITSEEFEERFKDIFYKE